MSTSKNNSPPAVLGIPLPVLACAVIALILRLAHLSSATSNPLRYQPAPDEDFYLTFASAIAAGDVSHPIYGFMDPLYGYILWILGSNPFMIAFVQVLLDTCSTGLVALLALRWHGSRASWIAGLGYASSTAAIMYTTTVLKAPWVAAVIIAWVAGAMVVWRSNSGWNWISLGVLGGVAAALRGNLAALSVLMLCILSWQAFRTPRNTGRWGRAIWYAAGLAPIILLLSAHHYATTRQFSPLPSNSGIVLHQLYNSENPNSRQFSPDFVSNPHPREIWYGYKAEAERRTGHPLLPGQVDKYWRNEGLHFIFTEPWLVVRNMTRKTLELFANNERANNLSIKDERRFSIVLRWLPDLSGLWTALGLAGLWVLRKRPEALAITVPVIVVIGTFIVFFAEARFRFHLLPVSCTLAGVALSETWVRWRAGAWKSAMFLAAPLSLLSIIASNVVSREPPPPTDWERIAQGYASMNDDELARSALADWEAEQGQTGDMLRIRAFIGFRKGDLDAAIENGRASIRINPRDATAWYNLALALDGSGDRAGGVQAAETAATLSPSPRNQLLWATALELSGNLTEAQSIYNKVLTNAKQTASPLEQQQAGSGLARIRNMQNVGAN